MRTRLALIFAAVALLYAGPALLPGRVFFPVDVLRDSLAWKRDPAVRVRVSNSILSDPVVLWDPWNHEIRRMLARGEMPWVNRFAGDGGPLFANPQTAHGFPCPRWEISESTGMGCPYSFSISTM